MTILDFCTFLQIAFIKVGHSTLQQPWVFGLCLFIRIFWEETPRINFTHINMLLKVLLIHMIVQCPLIAKYTFTHTALDFPWSCFGPQHCIVTLSLNFWYEQGLYTSWWFHKSLCPICEWKTPKFESESFSTDGIITEKLKNWNTVIIRCCTFWKSPVAESGEEPR